MARSLALAGSTRPDRPCAWIEPEDDVRLQVAAAAGDLVFDIQAAASRGDAGLFVLPPRLAPARPAAAALLAAVPFVLPADRLVHRAALARGPPALLS
jgi:hypothetical protein